MSKPFTDLATILNDLWLMCAIPRKDRCGTEAASLSATKARWNAAMFLVRGMCASRGIPSRVTDSLLMAVNEILARLMCAIVGNEAIEDDDGFNWKRVEACRLLKMMATSWEEQSTDDIAPGAGQTDAHSD